MEALDVLRGVAVLGILIVNIQFFAFPFDEAMDWSWSAAAWPDRVSHLFVTGLFEMKFITIFSLLFGAGLALQDERLSRAGASFAKIYSRRLCVLLILGVLHGIFLWYGDILTMYALIGFIGMACRRMRPRVMLLLAAILFVIPPLALSRLMSAGDAASTRRDATATTSVSHDGSAVTGAASSPANGDQVSPRNLDVLHGVSRFLDDETRIYQSGRWWEMVLHRSFYYAMTCLFGAILFGWRTLAMFLCGMALVRLRLFDAAQPGVCRFWRFVLVMGLVAGVPIQIFQLMLQVGGGTSPWAKSANFSAIWVASLGLAAVYVSVVVLACRREVWQRRLSPIAAAGRMALTNYLGQSLVCGLVFYGYGLGLFARVPHAATAPIALGVFLLELGFSVWWLRRLRFGPIEWLWRSMTYWRLQPLRKSALEAGSTSRG